MLSYSQFNDTNGLTLCFIFKFDITVDKESSEKQLIKQVVRKQLSALVKENILHFAKDLIESRCKGINFRLLTYEAISTLKRRVCDVS
jgi:hypothetical protein